MFDVHLLDEARAVAAALPLETKKILAELLGLLEIEPYTGDLYRHRTATYEQRSSPTVASW